jgi:NADH-quinone oxidoreductase subunit J
LERLAVGELFNPVLMFAGCALGAVGVCMALPRRGINPQVIGALVAGLGLGLMLVALLVKSAAHAPNLFFYVFSAIGLGAALRVISHPRPVYAALYFIMTILASSGLYVLLAAEFMAFALIIVYAGAILITYLFVIMLATESPTADEVEALAEYDRYSREPVIATVFAFVLLAGMTTLFAKGAAGLEAPAGYGAAARIEELPGKIEVALRNAGSLPEGGRVRTDDSLGRGTARAVLEQVDGRTYVQVFTRGGQTNRVELPATAAIGNVEGVGFSLLSDQPGSIEIAGVVLLMAMLGAVVLARKKVDLDEQALAARVSELGRTTHERGPKQMTPGEV